MNLTGHKLGKYEISERLGKGGMATVYKAYQPGVERVVAVKVLHKHLAADPDFVERFHREARAAGQLLHMNLVRLIDFDIEGDQHYMIMDYIQGGTLAAYMKKNAPLPTESVLAIMAQLTDALGYAHELGMIHRDIKPANIMFMDKEATHIVLTDFGLARILAEDGMTVTGQMIGTPAYMSLEAIRGEKVDKRTDIYSLGVVLYEMLSARTPYTADTPYKMILQQLHDPLPSLRQFNPDVPEVVEKVVMKALAKEPADRFQSAEEFNSAIQQAEAALNAGRLGSSRPRAARPVIKAQSTPKHKDNKSKQNNLMPLILAVAGVLFIAFLVVSMLS